MSDCGWATMNRCYGTIPYDNSRPLDLYEVIYNVFTPLNPSQNNQYGQKPCLDNILYNYCRKLAVFIRLKCVNGFVRIYIALIVLGFCTIKLRWIVSFLTALRKTSTLIVKRWDLLSLEHLFLNA